MSIRDESRRTATRSNFFLIILLGVHSIAAHAVESLPTRNQFALTRNHGGEVCNVYLANLNRLEKWVPDGGRKIMPDNNSLESVTWESFFHSPLIPESFSDANWKLRGKIDHYLWLRDYNPVNGLLEKINRRQSRLTKADLILSFEDYRNRVKAADITGNNRLVALIDIDNDGTDDLLYQEYCPCSRTLVVLLPNTSAVDKRKSQLLMRHPPFNRKAKNLFDSEGTPLPNADSGLSYGGRRNLGHPSNCGNTNR